MARSLHKKSRLTIRFSPDQRRRLDQAVQLETRRRGEVVETATLVRELVMPRIDEILAAAQSAQQPAA